MKCWSLSAVLLPSSVRWQKMPVSRFTKTCMQITHVVASISLRAPCRPWTRVKVSKSLWLRASSSSLSIRRMRTSCTGDRPNLRASTAANVFHGTLEWPGKNSAQNSRAPLSESSLHLAAGAAAGVCIERARAKICRMCFAFAAGILGGLTKRRGGCGEGAGCSGQRRRWWR